MVKLLRRFNKVTNSAAQLLINMLIEEYPLDETDTPKLQSKHPLNSLKRAMLHWSVLFAQCICLTSSMKPWSKKLHKALKVHVCNGRHAFSDQ
ncbi:hypothetical protein Tco_0628157 [Tanacetum coccineum]|uniref:Uncharacterized protein n=1 Tax=Tanacetum coccineum TaxID=301880 RepID=A0ABQ4WPG1_9ASTR